MDKLSFGSESADAEKIIKIARIAVLDEFKYECANLSKEQGSASAYFDLLAEKSGCEAIKSNDILGIEYTKAIIKSGYKMQICPLKREGNAYRDTELSLGALPSASAIREVISRGKCDEIASFVPAATLDILKGNELADFNNVKEKILLTLRLIDGENLNVAISDKGLVNRILSTAHKCASFDEFEYKLQTKKYTASAIRRAILYILLGIQSGDLDSTPQYTVLLGANERGREHLSLIRKSESEIRVITKPADAKEGRQLELSKKADALYTMCFENKKESGFYIRKSPIIV